MAVLIKSNKMSDVSEYLANLTGMVSIQDIVDTILQVSNLKSKTLEKLKTELYGENVHTVPLSELYVDMTYQRRIRLQQILNKLTAANGFDIHGAGAVDIAVRPDGKKFVWDGLRRCIMAGLCGLDKISASIYQHNFDEFPMKCQQKEARFFKMRNADSEKMKPEEIFKSKIAYRDGDSMKILGILCNCNLDVEGLNPGGKVLGGFAELLDNINRTKEPLEEKHLVSASRIIQAVYNKEQNVSVYLLTGLAWLLSVNDGTAKSYSEEEILDSFMEQKSSFPKQSSLTGNRLTRRGRESVAYLIAKSILKDDNKNNNGILNKIGLDKDEVEFLEAA
jgi:hypothetical protein